jgi:F-type H+-transporting ATPase subunit b
MMKRISIILFSLLALFAISAFAQEKPATPAPESEKKVETTKEPEKKAEAGEKKESVQEEAHDEEAQFKESASVKKLAGWLGLTVTQAFWVSTLLNFAVIAGLIFFGMKSGLPKLFRDRTSAIQKGIEEARKASAESAAKLQDIEARLAKLDQDIAAMKSQAEQDAEAEDKRLRAATEEEKKKIIEISEQEIAAASNVARRELKKYAAELAIALAEKKVNVDEASDKNLVREFAAQMGTNADGKGRS